MSQRIIAVDDSDIAQDFIRATLADIGFEDVVGFIDPREALRAMEKGDAVADLILMDIMMPEIDGIELCARVRGLKEWSDVPIIMLTSRTDMDSLSEAFLAGANDYVTKPFNRIELQARMRSCLRLKSELDRRRSGEAKSRRLRRNLSAAQGIVNLIGSKAGFEANLLALPRKVHEQVGLVVFKIDGEHSKADFSPIEWEQMKSQVASLLGQVKIKAQDMFAHWEDDLFCLAMLDASPDLMQQCAEQFIKALTSSHDAMRKDWKNRPTSISACLVPPGKSSLANSLAKGIQGAEKAGRSRQTGAVILMSNNENSQQ
ncbi:response regulator [Sulfitobacter sp. BDSS02]|uniref:response regulator n=1 Tax=Heliomarina sp. TaxID=2917556 RepID=UPI00405A080B|nr:response regulator [Sulfitobacter sp. BDSS02]MBR9852179.1 response regulator [Paracoccaceae bacterium]